MPPPRPPKPPPTETAEATTAAPSRRITGTPTHPMCGCTPGQFCNQPSVRPVRRSVPFENRKVCLRSFQQPFPRYRGQHNTHQEWITILVGAGGDGDAFERLAPSARRLEFMHPERLSAACSDGIRQGISVGRPGKTAGCRNWRPI
jgi:hypothetical protein